MSSSSSIDFVVQPINYSLLGIEAQTKKLSRWFWCSNHQTVAGSFNAQIGKPKQPVLRSNRKKPWTLILRLNQETRAPHLLVHGADRTRRHSTSRSSDHRVPDLCLTISDYLHQVSYSCHNVGCCPPCHTYHLHIMRQVNMILYINMIDISRTIKTSRIHHNQTNVLTT
jgi:hypothetical protein